MLGAWVSAFATFAAVLVALWAAKKQADEARQLAVDLARDERGQDAVRCLHHSMAVVNDLRGRVTSIRKLLTETPRPLAVLTLNVATTMRRYRRVGEYAVTCFIRRDSRELYVHYRRSSVGA